MTERGHSYHGLWINFEAGEGAGKGIQQGLLVDYLKNRGFVVQSGREPGTIEAGERIRRLLLDPDIPKLNPKTEMLLFIGAGIEFFEQLVKPSLEKGEIYITDRWRYSTMAYQGYGLGVDLNVIDTLTKFSCSGSYPDITFLLDIDPELGLSKITGNEFAGGKKDKIESRDSEYHRTVNQRFREIAGQNPDRFVVIPYIEGNPDEIQAQIRRHVEEFMEEYSLEGKLARVKL